MLLLHVMLYNSQNGKDLNIDNEFKRDNGWLADGWGVRTSSMYGRGKHALLPLQTTTSPASTRQTPHSYRLAVCPYKTRTSSSNGIRIPFWSSLFNFCNHSNQSFSSWHFEWHRERGDEMQWNQHYNKVELFVDGICFALFVPSDILPNYINCHLPAINGRWMFWAHTLSYPISHEDDTNKHQQQLKSPKRHSTGCWCLKADGKWKLMPDKTQWGIMIPSH